MRPSIAARRLWSAVHPRPRIPLQPPQDATAHAALSTGIDRLKACGQALVVLAKLVWETFREWRNDRATLQGAALAFYALFSMAPLLLLTTAVIGLVFGDEAAAKGLTDELRTLMTPEVAAAAQVLIAEAGATRSGWAAGSILGLGATLYGAMRGFFHLQATLNQVWGVKAIRGPGILQTVRRKLLAFASVALCGLLLIVSITATMVFHAVARRAADAIHPAFDLPGLSLARMSEELSTFVLVAILLMVVYKTLPDVRIAWSDVVVGALVSATLFLIGKQAIALYLRSAGIGTMFGAASALVVLLVYIQYMAQVLLFGAEFTYVFAKWRGKPIEPGPGAARVVRTTVRTELPRPAAQLAKTPTESA